MKSTLIAVFSFVAMSLFGANFESSKESISNVPYSFNGSKHELKLDYSVSAPNEKMEKLAEAITCKEYLTNQLLAENEKFDKLMVQKRHRQRGKSRKINRDIAKQLKVTSELLVQAEAITDYIAWLR